MTHFVDKRDSIRLPLPAFCNRVLGTNGIHTTEADLEQAVINRTSIHKMKLLKRILLYPNQERSCLLKFYSLKGSVSY